MIYEGKEYKEVTGNIGGIGKNGDLIHVTEVNGEVCDVWCFTTDSNSFLPSVNVVLSDGNDCLDSDVDIFTRYRYVKDVEETPAPKEKNIPLTDSLRYSKFNTPAYKLKRSIKKLYEEMSELITAKNENYGDSFSKQYQKYGMASVEMRLNDKFMRLEQLVAGEKDKVGESIEDTLKDIIGYATLALIELESEK
ncbi:nucleotide modification associated domain-containing protein [Brochothrix thermosphacta]|uniref:nucleotide modification associated domain-containing protein n=1 Tax=Brochothrix thermosphacta TaxID=2756 RepID=UPI001146831C|nr:nucleotide modification associated domain-containing protein [Brochothrix thermosphacta]